MTGHPPAGRSRRSLLPLKSQSPRHEHGAGLATRHGTSPSLEDMLEEPAEK
jgi:hypothetical protein